MKIWKEKIIIKESTEYKKEQELSEDNAARRTGLIG